MAKVAIHDTIWTPAKNAMFDVIVAGSGSAALTAALTAASGGASVLILEKNSRIGGTSAMSGGGTWIPCNRHAQEAGISDSPEEALEYLKAASPPGWEAVEAELWERFVDQAPRMIDFVEAQTPLRFELLTEPDPMAEYPGGKAGGRMISPRPLSRRVVGKLAGRLRRSTLPHIFTYRELVTEDPYHAPVLTAFRCAPQIISRWLTDSRGQGTALVTGLLRGCIDKGCKLSLESPVTALVTDDQGTVNGVKASIAGQTWTISARRGVVLATGGFEWDNEMLERHFPGGVERLGSPRSNTGDGQKLAEKAGARLDRMDQANIYPLLPVHYDGRLHGIPVTYQAQPHAIVVNASGKRFASEYDYNIGEALDRRDPASGMPVNLPAWVIGDSRMLTQSPLFRWYAGKHAGWMRKAPTIEALAGMTGLPPGVLTDTIARWNQFCANGVDEDFHRGETIWQRYKSGGESDGRNVTLGKIELAPFVALSFNRATVGTKGGARTNARGQVLRPDGSVIGGLYAAGNVMANPIGTRALGAGTTIGPCMTWGYICGNTILSSNR